MLKCPEPHSPAHLFGQPRSRQRRYRKHQHAAALPRAFTGAKLLLGIPIQAKTQAEASELVASSPAYIQAAVALLEAEVPALVESVLRGDVSLLTAARSVRKR